MDGYGDRFGQGRSLGYFANLFHDRSDHHQPTRVGSDFDWPQEMDFADVSVSFADISVSMTFPEAPVSSNNNVNNVSHNNNINNNINSNSNNHHIDDGLPDLSPTDASYSSYSSSSMTSNELHELELTLAHHHPRDILADAVASSAPIPSLDCDDLFGLSNNDELVPDRKRDHEREEVQEEEVASPPTPPKKKRRRNSGPVQRKREYKDDQWDQRFQDLERYRDERGDCLVPYKWKPNPALAQWVKRQRYQYKLWKDGEHSTLTPARREALESLGFVWSSHDEIWNERYAELVQYERRHGHCNVPNTFPENPPLSMWVRSQRRKYKQYTNGVSTAITPERIERLETLGFLWSTGPAAMKTFARAQNDRKGKARS